MQQKEQQAAEELSVEILYQRYASAIFAYIYRQISSREDAEDILVEVFLAALESANFSLLNEQAQQAWLWRVARNKTTDYYRRFSRQPSVNLKQVVETIYEDEALAPEHIVLKQEEYTDLSMMLKTLSAAQQEVLRLRFGHGLSCMEIASVLQKSEGAVRMLLSRTLKLLRVIYKK